MAEQHADFFCRQPAHPRDGFRHSPPTPPSPPRFISNHPLQLGAPLTQPAPPRPSPHRHASQANGKRRRMAARLHCRTFELWHIPTVSGLEEFSQRVRFKCAYISTSTPYNEDKLHSALQLTVEGGRACDKLHLSASQLSRLHHRGCAKLHYCIFRRRRCASDKLNVLALPPLRWRPFCNGEGSGLLIRLSRHDCRAADDLLHTG